MNSLNPFSNSTFEDFTGKILNGVNLSGYDLRNRNFREATANGADFSRTMLNGANFEKAEMCGVDLSKAVLCGGNFSEANLSGANLQRSDFGGAILYRTNLTNADITDIDLNGATVEDAKFINCRGLNQEIIDDLKRRGAIVENTITSKQVKQEKDIKWWLQYIFVPLIIAFISSGSIMSFVKEFKNKPNLPSPSSEIESTKAK